MKQARDELTVPPDGQSMDAQPKWRQDFPIDWPEDHYVSRRDFTKFMVLTSLAFAVGQFWIGIQNYLRRRRGSSPIQRLDGAEQLPVGGALTFAYPDDHDSCILIRLDERNFVAFSQKCTHLSCAVTPRFDQGCLNCPCHEGSFDLRSGAPIAGPPRRPLPRISLQIRDGAVYATGVELRTT